MLPPESEFLRKFLPRDRTTAVVNIQFWALKTMFWRENLTRSHNFVKFAK